MTPKQVILVKNSWAHVLPIADKVAKLFYEKAFELEPPLQSLFTGNITEQGHKLMQMIDTVVNSLDKLNAIMPAVDALGERHAEYGVKDKDYETFGIALLWALETYLGERFTAEVKQAWSNIYEELASTMRAAARVAA